MPDQYPWGRNVTARAEHAEPKAADAYEHELTREQIHSSDVPAGWRLIDKDAEAGTKQPTDIFWNEMTRRWTFVGRAGKKFNRSMRYARKIEAPALPAPDQYVPLTSRDAIQEGDECRHRGAMATTWLKCDKPMFGNVIGRYSSHEFRRPARIHEPAVPAHGPIPEGWELIDKSISKPEEGDKFWSEAISKWIPAEAYQYGNFSADTYIRKSPSPTPAPEQLYREMGPGDVIRPGDQARGNLPDSTWEECTHTVGMVIKEGCAHEFRRPVNSEWATEPEQATEGDLLREVGMDGKKWAEEFMRIVGGGRVTIDEGLMISWFCNAIMAGYDEGRREVCKDEPTPEPDHANSPESIKIETEIQSARALLVEAFGGSRGPDQQAIAREVVRWGAQLLRKNADYGSSVWKRPLLAPECDEGTAIRVRMSDKLCRLITLLENSQKGSGPEFDESIDDTMQDFACYCLLELARPGRKSLGKNQEVTQ